MESGVKKLIIGGAAAAVLAAATAALLLYEPEDGGSGTGIEIENTNETIFENADADMIVVTTDEREVRYIRNGEEWTIEGFSGDQLDPSKLQSFISGATRYVSSTVIGDAADLSEYGLDAPTVTVTVSGGGSEDVIEIGGKSAVENKYFAMYNGTVFTMQAAQYTKLLSEPSYFMEFTRVAIDPENITGIRIERPDSTVDLYIPEITRLEGNVWQMREPYETMANDTFIDSDVLEQIGGLTMSRPASELGGARATLTVTAGDEEYVFTVGASDGGSVYVGYNGGVYKESASLLGFVDADVFNYVNKLVSYENILDISSVSVEYGETAHVLEIAGDDDAQTFKADGRDMDASDARTLYREIIGITGGAMYDGSAVGDIIMRVAFTDDDGAETVVEYRAVNEYSAAAFRDGTALMTVNISDIDRLKEIVDSFFSE